MPKTQEITQVDTLQDIEACEKGQPFENSNNYFNRKNQEAVSTEN